MFADTIFEINFIEINKSQKRFVQMVIFITASNVSNRWGLPGTENLICYYEVYRTLLIVNKMFCNLMQNEHCYLGKDSR